MVKILTPAAVDESGCTAVGRRTPGSLGALKAKSCAMLALPEVVMIPSTKGRI